MNDNDPCANCTVDLQYSTELHNPNLDALNHITKCKVPAVGDFYGTGIEILAECTGPKFWQHREHLHLMS